MSAPDTPPLPERPSHFDIADEDVILELRELRKEYLVHHGKTRVKAVDGVSLQLRRGEILGLVGESGCGKTTTGKLIMRLVEPTSGSIMVNGVESMVLAATCR
jgi:peptide/nickel transport system ATP-binding protein